MSAEQMPQNARRIMRPILSSTKPAPSEKMPSVNTPTTKAGSDDVYQREGRGKSVKRTYLGRTRRSTGHSVRLVSTNGQGVNEEKTYNEQEGRIRELAGADDPARLARRKSKVLLQRGDRGKQGV